ncbi:sushi, nidogen and EGF-like domain-containing protein 1 [Caloenas nicobarica]|uniref:sushi, nidogen and EGF-like domain-containing protein 1 n=1 Tax=Caloenas nicobarica TaxID=187106 RepID=UPI0032B7A88A
MGQRQVKVTPVLLLLSYVGGVLYPFGPQVGDTATPREDDGMSPEIHLWETFPFYGHAHRTVYVGDTGTRGRRGVGTSRVGLGDIKVGDIPTVDVSTTAPPTRAVPTVIVPRPGVTLCPPQVNNNGVVSFGVGVPEFTPEPFPLPQRPLLAPFWADVDTRLAGDVFYRQSRQPALLARLGRDIVTAVPSPGPPPTWAFVATWDRVTFFGAATQKVNTFQAVLATNGVNSYVMFNYGDLSWTTGIANQGDAHTGLGGTAAQAGFNSGDPAHYATLPGSRSPRVLGVARGTNVGVPGRWIFRVDVDVVTPGPPDVPPGGAPDDVTGEPADDVTTTPPRPSTRERVYLCRW